MSESAVPAQLRPYAWKKGQSGNPNGRPKGRHTLEALVNKELDKAVKVNTVEGPESITQRELFARKLVQAALADVQSRVSQALVDRQWPEEHKLKTAEGDMGGVAVVLAQDYNDRPVPEQLEALIEKLRVVGDSSTVIDVESEPEPV